MNNKWDQLADDQTVTTTIEALKKNNINAMIVENSELAKQKVLDILPKGAEVFTGQSATLDQISLRKAIDESGEYDSVRKKIMSSPQQELRNKMRKESSIVDYFLGSVHAVTQEGQVITASNTGSQLPAYAFSAAHVIWVVGTQKIVKNIDEGMKRIYEYVLKLESENLKKLYGVASNVSKLLIINKEISPDRITLIFVKEKLGF